MRPDRLLVAAFVVLVSTAIVGFSTGNTGASFTSGTTNPTNSWNTVNVQPPAAQNAAVSVSGGTVNLSWAATPTAPNGHTITYLVLRNGAQIGTTASLVYSDTPVADGTYSYTIQTKIAQGAGFFTSGNSVAQNGKSDRTAPAMSATCNGAACVAWYNATVAVAVNGNDGAGVGMGTATTNVDGAGAATSAAPRSVNVSGQLASHGVVYSGADAAGNTSGNTTLNFGIDLTAPTAATAVGGGPGSQNGEIALTWTKGADALSGVANQTIHRTNAVGACPAVSLANYPNATVVLATAASATITGLVQNSKYCFYVTTTDKGGNATDSARSGLLTSN
ncbi:MAG TPA: hypothetical protein VGS17_03745 [Candidatus Limnocylindria bacterium]|nr:hypothetical protein [Candidatus Limnocylindria bacterium]